MGPTNHIIVDLDEFFRLDRESQELWKKVEQVNNCIDLLLDEVELDPAHPAVKALGEVHWAIMQSARELNSQAAAVLGR